MAFNFNWSPLIADTSRARDMLTTALNKSPKPPIIVDDIIVNELNLGSIPPELEILEIGDLAEDRFRGIFKMSYTGDAYLTLKTRVQANPLNTFLSTKPSFASPQPLAASSGLTIPIQITLSDIRLSGFVILVFSRQKGITLVFRNDPLESLKVSSTFDSIPFVRDYLQKEIEKQLRVLFMDDLPAIIHRLSLRAFVPDYRRAEDEEAKRSEPDNRSPVDPLASPPQNPLDSWADNLDDDSAFSLDSSTESYASFSQKNLLRLAALSESQRTLSLFTPAIRDTVFRAWAGAREGTDSPGTATPYTRPHLFSRIHSSIGTASPNSCSSNASDTSEAPTHYSRPSVASISSTATVYTMGSHRARASGGRKRKHRVVDLRKSAHRDASDSDSLHSSLADDAPAPTITVTEPPPSPVVAESVPDMQSSTKTPQRVRFQPHKLDTSPTHDTIKQPLRQPSPKTEKPSFVLPANSPAPSRSVDDMSKPLRPKLTSAQSFPKEKKSDSSRSSSSVRLQTLLDGSSGGILEQAWMMKMAQEIARKVHEEKAAEGFWHQSDAVDQPPPAYGV
ncbi:hypothetical protein BDV97DRAFT_94382 [Delphinella strobiligena]|nr:hypothetical protein BDV97DRAFT_94382 [Delphinella strobiligena]